MNHFTAKARIGLGALVALAGLFAGATAAQAATSVSVDRSGNKLRISTFITDTNRIDVGYDYNTSEFIIEDFDGVSPGSECTQDGPTRARCTDPFQGFFTISASLGRGSDSFDMRGGLFSEVPGDINASVIGGGGRDFIRTDGDSISDRTFGDTLVGGNGADILLAGAGGDQVNGGAGPDRMQAGDGRDSMNAADGRRDPIVNCGDGNDDAVFDAGLDSPLSC
jgi:Ca2+-binding RTX toxin-like protein